MFLLKGVEVNEAILRNLSELSKSEQTFEQGVTYQKETLAPEVEIPIGIESILDEIFISEDRNLVEFLIESKLYTPLVRVLLNESNTTKEKFLNWFKLQEDYDETVVLPILEELRAVEMGNRIALSDVLALISTDQKRVLVCLMIKTQQWKSCNTLLQLESAEAQWAYVQWKTQPPTLYTDEDEEYFAPPHPEDEDFNTEANVTDTDISPDEWSPSFGHSFFQHFPPEMNILVLGESGVGKSSFINGIANYLKFPNIHVAKENCEVLIEAHFTLLDQELKSRRIICKPTIKQTEEESSNERTDVAHSCTKEPKAYQFSVGQGAGQKTIRIIDTPGIGDTAGIEQDHENFRKILTYLSNYQEIHAILILLKPNEQRLRVPLRFCLNELFTHFHISARQNVIFCFTHARETFYDAGETKFLLEAHLHNIGNEIPLTEKTMYYFDSETFRFVCAWKDGVTFNADQEKIFNTSWQHSVNETFRLFEQVAKLPPHKTEETLGVNSLRQIVFAMARPMTEMARASAENARLIQKRVDEVNFLLRAGKDIGDKLFVEQISLEKETFDKPRTVCANCVELVPMIKGDSNSCFETIHKFICHDPCELNGVQTELFPNEALKNCWAFQEDESCCKICKCPWNSHLHITYRLKKKVTRILDTGVLNSNMSKIDQARCFKERAMKEKQRLEQQRDLIQRYCAEFGAYLRANSLIGYNDSYTEYVDYLITETIQLLEGQGRITDRVRTTEEIKIMVQDLKRSTGTILQDIQTLEWINVKKQNEDNAHRIPLKDSWMDRRYTCSEPEHYQKKGKKHNNFFGSAKDTARHLFGF